MSKSHQNLINLKPKVAILDDDKELTSDLISCINEEITLIEFSTVEQLKSQISTHYDFFLNSLISFLTLLSKNSSCINRLEEGFLELIENRPFSVALIDLNLENDHDNEGFEVCELLLPYSTKTLVYSGSEFSQLSLNLINQCVISGQLNKTSDLFEELIPAVFSLNQSFLNAHYNITHLASLKSLPLTEIRNNLSKKTMPSHSTQFIVYDEFINFLTK